MAKKDAEKKDVDVTGPDGTVKLITNDEGRKVDPLFGLAPGRVVHYVLPGGSHRPAIVVHVVSRDDGVINVQQFIDADADGHAPDNGTIYRGNVPFGTDGGPGSWHWPERAD